MNTKELLETIHNHDERIKKNTDDIRLLLERLKVLEELLKK